MTLAGTETKASVSQHSSEQRLTRQQYTASGTGAVTSARVVPGTKATDHIQRVADTMMHSLMRRHDDLQEFTNSAALTPRSSAASVVALEEMPTPALVRAIQESPATAIPKEQQLTQITSLLIKRAYGTPLSLSLKACHSFFLQEHNMSQYLSVLFSVTDETFDDISISPTEVTQLFLYIFIHGSAPQMLFYKVQGYLAQHLDKFHINDLSIICGGFFRANTRMTSQDLLNALALKMLREIDSLEPFLLSNILKMFRHASYICVSFYQQLGDYLVESDYLSKFKSMNPVIHLAFTYASLTIQHEPLFEQLLAWIERTLSSQQKMIRSKDLSKFIWACGTLQFKPAGYPRRYQKLVEAFENSRGSQIYPESLGELLVGLIYLEIFPVDLLSRCLSPVVSNQLMETKSEREKNMQLMLLHETAQIECPWYKGNLLSQAQVRRLSHHPLVAHDLHGQLRMRVGLAAVLHLLQEKLGADKVQCHYPLPHFNSAVIELQHCCQHGFLSFTPRPVKYGKGGSYTHQAITGHLLAELTGQPPPADDESSVTRVGLVVAGNHQHALNSRQPLGHWNTKLRQLHAAGYTVCQILPEAASELEYSSHEERCQYLSERLSQCLHTNITL